MRSSGPEQRRARARDPPAVLAVARGPGCSRADVLPATHKPLYPGAARKRATGSSACPGGRGAFCCQTRTLPGNPHTSRCLQTGSYRSLPVAEKETAPARAVVLTCCPVSGTPGPGRSADSCQAVSDSRALPGLRHRVSVIRFFLTSRNGSAGPLEYHMASSTCCRLVSISLAGPTWLPLRTSPSCPSASSPAVSRLLQTLARPSSPRLTNLFLLRSQSRAPDCISRQAPRPVANRRPRIWRRRRRTGRGGFVRGGGGGGGGGDGGGSWRRGDPDRGRGRGWVTGCLLGEVCSFRSEPWDLAALRGRQPLTPLRHQQLRGDPRPAASPSLRVARNLPSASKTSPAGRAVAVLSTGRHGRVTRRGGNLVRGFHAA